MLCYQTYASINIAAHINVVLVYQYNFEKADSWPKLLELLDVLHEFNNQKILLEKIH